MKKYGNPVVWADVPTPEYIADDRQALDLLNLCMRKIEEDPGELIGFDTETHAMKLPFTVGNSYPLDWMHDTVLFWSLSFRVGEAYRRWCLQQQHLHMFVPFLESPDAWLTGWNLKYDGHVCWNSGINIWNANIVDGLALNGMYDENRMSNSLKDCAYDYCGLSMTPFNALFGDKDENGNKIKEFETNLLTLPTTKVSDYASYDAYAALMSVFYLIEKLQNSPVDLTGRNLWDVFLDLEMPITQVLWRMERRGIPVDVPYLESKIPVLNAEILELEKKINQQVGVPVNINSPKQISNLFFGHTKNGGMGLTPVKMTKGGAQGPQPSVDEEVLGLLVEQGIELAVSVVRCRQLYKARNTYFETLSELAKYYGDGCLHPNFNQRGTRTGRLSTTVPNSQNLPRPDTDEFKVRRAFVAGPGKKLIVADYEQVEMRIMADRSGDLNMIRAIQEGKDLHSFTVAKMMPGIAYEEVVAAKKSKEPTDHQRELIRHRQDMKAVGFGIIYGAGAGKIGATITIPDEEIRLTISQTDKRSLEKAVARAQKRNPLLTTEKAVVIAAREKIAQAKIDGYFRAFPGVKQYMDDTVDLCSNRQYMRDPFGDPKDPDQYIMKGQDDHGKTIFEPLHEYGFVQTLTGQYRRLVDINNPNREMRGHAEREAINTTIQGAAADIVKAAMLRIEFGCEALKELGVEIVNQIHDELVMTVPEKNAEAAVPHIKECMEHPFEEGKDPICVPTPVDIKIVDTWDKAK